MCCRKRGNNRGPPIIRAITTEQMVQMSRRVNPRKRQWLEVPLPGAGFFIPSSVKWEKV